MGQSFVFSNLLILLSLLLPKIYIFVFLNMIVFFFNFCHIAKYKNSDLVKLSTESVFVKHP